MSNYPSNQTIIPATAQDYDEIVTLWEASVRATHHFLAEEDIQFFKPLLKNEYLRVVNLFCTKDAAGKILGFLGTSSDKIEMLFIDPAQRGKGIGKELLLYAIHNLQVKKVDVNEQNEQAVEFYKKFGFQTLGRSPEDNLGKPYPILHMEIA